MENNFYIPSSPWSNIGKKIESLCRKALYDFNMLKEVKGPLAIALSGGKDSLTLLHMLKNISGRGFPSLDLHAIHVDGAFSCGAELNKNYLKKMCAALDVKLTFCHSDIKLENLECYSCARERRKLIFREAKKSGCDFIAFGHTKDDKNQTLLLNLFQKAEFATMLPLIEMQRFEVSIIRPLIYVEEKDIIQFAQQNHFLKARCNCPKSGTSHRKKVEDILTEIEKTFPKIRSNLALSADLYGSNKAANPLKNKT